ncbi:MAG: hypothetical protein K0U34_05900 [Alphaproteobacteria bacterium]|nr:hypothetical protein [Alphaproteobacteria bacterium]
MTWDSFSPDETIDERAGSEDITPAPQDVEFMALALEGRHGVHAAEIAAFFSDYHSGKGDAGRSWAWAGVAEVVRKRQQFRTSLDL